MLEFDYRVVDRKTCLRSETGLVLVYIHGMFLRDSSPQLEY